MELTIENFTPISDLSSLNYPIVILDTNLLIDCIENRDQNIKDYIGNELGIFLNKDLITIGLTVLNLAELYDKIFEINLQLSLIKMKYTSDLI
ncbi:MAG: hypothetical protein ACTSO9_06565, partial [Candidatus Helarchaeota archaeon]